MTRALIIGGGIGGLTSAIALRQVGLDVSVFERSSELREVGAGLTLWTNAIKCLRTLGVGSAIETLGTAFTQSEVRSWRGKRIVDSDLSEISSRLGAPTIGIHRADLQKALAAALPAQCIHFDATCSGFSQDASGVTAQFANGRQERGDLLIGADGIHSHIRTQMHGEQQPRYAGYYAWRGVGAIDHPAVPNHLTLMAIGRGSQFGIVPISRGKTYWFATMNGPGGGIDQRGQTKAFLLQRYRDWYAPIPAVIEATDESAIIRNDIIDRKPFTRWGEGRVTLLGDAAHPTTPNLGQGACMAIEDAIVLARSLQNGDDVAVALRHYENKRYERTAMITNRSWKIGKVLAWEGRWSCTLRDWLMRRMKRTMLKQTIQLIDVDI